MHRNNEILIHGLRVQAMFSYVVAALGYCKAIKEEDVGEIYAIEQSLQAPDFRVVTSGNQEFLVEVKNFHNVDPSVPYRMSSKYLESLQRYSALFQKELYLGIYWSKAKLWTLVHTERVRPNSDGYSLLLTDAIKANETHLLGDHSVAILPSLSLKLYSDPKKPRKVATDGLANFTVVEAELYCGDKVIDDVNEQQIAWILLNYGDWPIDETQAEISGGELISVSFQAAPAERANPNEQFEIVGILSGMLSRQYNEITAPSGPVERLSTDHHPVPLRVLIPQDYKGQGLPLWRFTIMPDHDD